MEWASTLKHAHISARKARLVADLVRGMPGRKRLLPRFSLLLKKLRP